MQTSFTGKKGQIDGRRYSGVWLEGVQLERCLEKRPNVLNSTGKDKIGNINKSFCSHKCRCIECLKLEQTYPSWNFRCAIYEA